MRTRLWWIGLLFMVGSTAFALGSAPFYAELVPPEAVGVTFFAGSIFFTTASLLQLKQTARIDRFDWWACVVQFAGTLFFNVTTFTALNDSLSTTQEDIRVWAPDAFDPRASSSRAGSRSSRSGAAGARRPGSPG